MHCNYRTWKLYYHCWVWLMGVKLRKEEERKKRPVQSFEERHPLSLWEEEDDQEVSSI